MKQGINKDLCIFQMEKRVCVCARVCTRACWHVAHAMGAISLSSVYLNWHLTNRTQTLRKSFPLFCVQTHLPDQTSALNHIKHPTSESQNENFTHFPNSHYCQMAVSHKDDTLTTTKKNPTSPQMWGSRGCTGGGFHCFPFLTESQIL